MLTADNDLLYLQRESYDIMALDLDDINSQAVEWRDWYANRRVHEATRKIPELMFAQERQVQPGPMKWSMHPEGAVGGNSSCCGLPFEPAW